MTKLSSYQVLDTRDNTSRTIWAFDDADALAEVARDNEREVDDRFQVVGVEAPKAAPEATEPEAPKPEPKPYNGKVYDVCTSTCCSDCAEDYARTVCSEMENDGCGWFYHDESGVAVARRNPFHVMGQLGARTLAQEVMRVATETGESSREALHRDGLVCESCGKVMATPKQVARMLK